MCVSPRFYCTVDLLRELCLRKARVKRKESCHAKGAGGGEAGREMINSNTSLPSIFTPKHYCSFSYRLWQVGFCLNLFFRQVFGAQLQLSYLNDHICDQQDNLLGSKIECVVWGWGGGGWWSLFQDGGIRILFLDHMLPKGLVLICWTASVVGNMRLPKICAFWFSFLFVWTVFVWTSFTRQNSFLVSGTVWCLVPEPWHLKHWRVEGVFLNSSTLEIMPVFWHISPPKVVPRLVLGCHF